MSTRTKLFSIIASALLISASSQAAPAKTGESFKAIGEITATSTEQLIQGWPAKSKEVAQTTIKKYGQPHEVTTSMLVWNNNGPWKRTIIYREPVKHSFPIEHQDVMQQFVNYQVPPQKFDELALYDGSVVAERTNGELSARCDKEPMNILALNLAHDVATGKKTVESARAYYAKTAMAFMNGKSDPYVEKLQFETMPNAGDPDKPAPGAKMAAK